MAKAVGVKAHGLLCFVYNYLQKDCSPTLEKILIFRTEHHRSQFSYHEGTLFSGTGEV